MEMETFQDVESTDPMEVQDASFATVAAIYDDGVTLIFDGMEEATEKRYQTNSFIVFNVGDRVRVIKDSGTYVVEYPIGPPRKSFSVDYATNASNAGYATSAGTADRANTANSTNSASNATQANYALRLRSNASSGNSTTIYFVVNSNGYYIGSNYLSGLRKITTS